MLLSVHNIWADWSDIWAEKTDIRVEKNNHLSGFTCAKKSSFEQIYLEKTELLELK
jgi:hypothetical protein